MRRSKTKLCFQVSMDLSINLFSSLSCRWLFSWFIDWRNGKSSSFFESLPLLIIYFTHCNHPNVAYCALFHLNNLIYWKQERPEILESICLNCDLEMDELIELVHGQVACNGHLNRNNPDEALMDILRLFVTRFEVTKVVNNQREHGEVYLRQKFNDSKKNEQNRMITRQFTLDLANGKQSTEFSNEIPFEQSLFDCLDGIKKYAVDY